MKVSNYAICRRERKFLYSGSKKYIKSASRRINPSCYPLPRAYRIPRGRYKIMPPHRSAKQRALATKNLALIHGQKPTQLPCEGENVDPNPDIQDEKITELEAALAKMKKRGDRYATNARNKTKEVARAKRSRDILREENYRHEHNLKMRGYRAPLQRQKLVEKTLRKTGVVPDVVFLKEKAVVISVDVFDI
ncbi:hypothetical protein M413DRAFT_428559 [Hebeloma cylindrosporum]|uniref:Uncharacterized protein n=1 Tax=Hebeloma cylindrosporum TaxID=76867 RepID=A0A0C2XCR7_HEBCY|nr:hypothetical protein M413DRAFT_428559 [Hebeloma cylindrosporum h7]